MPVIHPWETDIILWLRTALPGAVGVFEVITGFGGETFFLVLLPLLYWSVDRRLGTQVTILYLLSAYLNGAAKTFFSLPRPFDVDAGRLAPLFKQGIEAAREQYDATGNGFPSGHTQSTVVVWGFLATQVNKLRDRLQREPGSLRSPLGALIPALLALAALLIILVPLSRIYLAVHYPTDVLGGYLAGAAVLLLYLWLSPGAERRLARASVRFQLALVTAVPLLAILVVPTEQTTTAAAALLGMGVGFVLERRLVGFHTTGTPAQRSGRFMLGTVVLVGIYAGLRFAFAGLEPHLVFRFIRYALLGLWGALGAPAVFVRLGLAAADYGSDLKT